MNLAPLNSSQMQGSRDTQKFILGQRRQSGVTFFARLANELGCESSRATTFCHQTPEVRVRISITWKSFEIFRHLQKTEEVHWLTFGKIGKSRQLSKPPQAGRQETKGRIEYEKVEKCVQFVNCLFLARGRNKLKNGWSRWPRLCTQFIPQIYGPVHLIHDFVRVQAVKQREGSSVVVAGKRGHQSDDN